MFFSSQSITVRPTRHITGYNRRPPQQQKQQPHGPSDGQQVFFTTVVSSADCTDESRNISYLELSFSISSKQFR